MTSTPHHVPTARVLTIFQTARAYRQLGIKRALLGIVIAENYDALGVGRRDEKKCANDDEFPHDLPPARDRLASSIMPDSGEKITSNSTFSGEGPLKADVTVSLSRNPKKGDARLEEDGRQ